MGEKDITEKHLEAYADVFADIVTVTLLFGTGLKIEAEELKDASPVLMHLNDWYLSCEP